MRGVVDDTESRFPSKVDWWLPALLGLLLLAGPVMIVWGPKHRPVTPGNSMFIAAMLVFPILLVGWMFVSTVYVIDGANLVIKCGPAKIVVPIDSITAIERGSLASGPAMSLSRLCVRYGRFQEVNISPKDKRGFIHAIQTRVPHVILRDVDEYR